MRPVSRRLPRTLSPAPGESILGLILRNSCRLGVRPDLLLELDLRERLPPRWAAVLTPDEQTWFAHRFGLQEHEVNDLLINRYVHSISPRALETDNKRARWHSWTIQGASRYCPHCLPETSWRTAWRLQWSLACTTHGNWLNLNCPACGNRALGGRGKAFMPGPTLVTATASTCRWTEDDRDRHHAAERMCGADLEQAPTLPAPRWALEVQRTLDAALAGEVIALGSQLYNAEHFFALLRTILPILRATAPGREADANTSNQVADSPSNVLRPTARRRLHRSTDPDLIIASSQIKDAIQLLHQNPSQLQQSVRQLLDHLPPNVRDHLRNLPEQPEPLTRVLLGPAARLNRDLRTRPRPAQLHSSHIPQVLPADLVTAHLPESWTSERELFYVRRYGALYLARLVGASSWQQAAEQLDIPVTVTAQITQVLAVLDRDDQLRPTNNALNELGNNWSDVTDGVDYAARRHRLAQLLRIPDPDAGQLQQQLRNPRATRQMPLPRFQQFAAATLWVNLTQGDSAHAPALRDRTRGLRAAWLEWDAKLTQQARDHLHTYGLELLRRLPGRRRRPAA